MNTIMKKQLESFDKPANKVKSVKLSIVARESHAYQGTIEKKDEDFVSACSPPNCPSRPGTCSLARSNCAFT